MMMIVVVGRDSSLPRQVEKGEGANGYLYPMNPFKCLQNKSLETRPYLHSLGCHMCLFHRGD